MPQRYGFITGPHPSMGPGTSLPGRWVHAEVVFGPARAGDSQVATFPGRIGSFVDVGGDRYGTVRPRRGTERQIEVRWYSSAFTKTNGLPITSLPTLNFLVRQNPELVWVVHELRSGAPGTQELLPPAGAKPDLL